VAVKGKDGFAVKNKKGDLTKVRSTVQGQRARATESNVQDQEGRTRCKKRGRKGEIVKNGGFRQRQRTTHKKKKDA